MIGRYLDPGTDTVKDVEVAGMAALDQLLLRVKGLNTLRGIPAVELCHENGTVIAVGQADDIMVLLFTDGLGASWHTVGPWQEGGPYVIDYMGSHTELPAEYFVTRGVGLAAADAFLTTGSPFVPDITMEPD